MSLLPARYRYTLTLVLPLCSNVHLREKVTPAQAAEGWGQLAPSIFKCCCVPSPPLSSLLSMLLVMTLSSPAQGMATWVGFRVHLTLLVSTASGRHTVARGHLLL